MNSFVLVLVSCYATTYNGERFGTGSSCMSTVVSYHKTEKECLEKKKKYTIGSSEAVDYQKMKLTVSVRERPAGCIPMFKDSEVIKEYKLQVVK